ncbi:MAG TPA: DUF3750 domain-containing protein [Pseudolabrys sp.]|nr:DUF3750 domain-containing protein [Pseudolabrys sp.]
MTLAIAPAHPRRRFRKAFVLLFVAVFLLPIATRAMLFAVGNSPHSWRDADWSSTGLLPSAADYKPARVIVFTATTGSWKGIFAVHSWLVLKRAGATEWTRYDVVGWGSPVRTNNWPPDGLWYGNRPVAIVDVNGAAAAELIPKIERAIRSYSYRNDGDYRIWPGPNSNTFTAAVLRAVPELGVTLPSNAIGRDFRGAFYVGLTDSGTGIEVNFWGLADFKIGWVEGIEVNLLGLVAGFDFRHPAIKLPGYGRIAFEPALATAR